MNIERSVLGAVLAMMASGLGGCANETGPGARSTAPAYLGSDIHNMGGARSLAPPSMPGTGPIIEPTTSSKVLSAIVFERVTGHTAYPDGAAFAK